MATMKTPGVYIVEKNAFPNSVVEVATAVPAFIGYTEKADNKGTSLASKPWRITSMAEFEMYYGGAPTKGHVRFSLSEAPAAAPAAADEPEALAARDATPLSVAGKQYLLKQETGRYLLHYAMQLFFLNGGGPCYVVSVGGYERDDKDQPAAGVKIDKSKLADALQALLYEQEPTMVVVPDAVSLSRQDCYALQQDALMHCGYKMKNRFAILDVWEGYRPRKDFECIDAFRNDVGTSFLNFGAAYYPWLQTSVVSERDLSYFNLATESWDTLKACMKDELAALNTPAAKLAAINKDVVDKIDATSIPAQPDEGLCKSLPVVSPFYRGLMAEMARRLNLLPPSAAMAGIYTMVDNTRGVWKAPANVSLNSVVAPSVTISHDEQEDLNVTPMGKSINAVRSFIGEGTLVWGARTLDGNSLDWRYVNVRRTMIMLEESIRLASKALVFEPNVSTTWVTMKSMISNFLTSVWKRGGLAGASPDDAFSVHVGLGETMTPEDILEGILRVTVLVAITRPAEFIEITFQQQMQKS